MPPPTDATLLNEVRRQALSECPDVFGASYADEAALDAAAWIASDPERVEPVVGVVAVLREMQPRPGGRGCSRCGSIPNTGAAAPRACSSVP